MKKFAISPEEQGKLETGISHCFSISKKMLITACLIAGVACSTQVKNQSQNSDTEIRPISAIEKRFHDRF